MSALPDTTPLTASLTRAATRFVVKTYWDSQHLGRDHVPSEGPAVLICNHPTYFDPWVVAYGTPRWITWLAWEEVFRWPVVGTLITAMGAVPLNTERPNPSTLKAAMQVLEAGRLLGIFFEGKRTSSGNFQLDPPMPGAARLAIKADAPIVPVSLAGARRLWPIEGLPRPGSVRVRYHPPLHPAEVTDLSASVKVRAEHLTALVSQQIRSGLPPCGRPRA